jgi:hypothetical protein
MANINLATLNIDVSALITSTAEVKKTLDDLQKKQAELKKSGESGSEQFIKNASDLKILSAEYNAGIKAITQNTQATADAVNKTQLMELALKGEVNSIAEARAQNALLTKLRNETNTSTKEGKEELDALNNKLNQNNEYIKDNGDKLLQQKQNIGNYKDSVKEALQETGLFGGEMQKLTSIFKPAIDVVKNYYQDIVAGANQIKNSAREIEGMTLAQKAYTIATQSGAGALQIFKAALAATGIGLLVIGVGLLINGLSKLDPIMDKIEQLTAGVGGAISKASQIVVSFVSNITSVGDAFSKISNLILNPFDSIKNFSKEVVNAGKAVAGLKAREQELGDLKDIYEVRNKNIESQIALDKIKLKSKDLTAKEEIEIEKRINSNFEKLSNNKKEVNDKTLKLNIDSAIETSAELSAIDRKRLEESIKLGDLEVANELLNGEKIVNGRRVATGKITKEAYEKLKESTLQVADSNNQLAEENARAQDKIEKAQEKAEANAQKNRDAQIKRIDETIAKSKTELDIFIFNSNEKSKTLEKELQSETQIRDKKLAILKTELQNGKITKEQFQLSELNTKKEFLQKQSELILNQSKAELDLFIAKNQSVLVERQKLTADLLASETQRLEQIKLDNINIVEQEKKTNQQIIDNKKLNNIELSVADLEYLTAKANIETEFDATVKANKKSLEEQEKQIKLEQLAIDKEIAIGNATTQLEVDLLNIQNQYDAEKLLLEDKLAKQQITQEQFDAKLIQSDAKKKELMRLADLNDTKTKLGEFQKLGAGLEGLFGKNKALASAMAGINTALAVTEILSTKSVLPEPIASISRGVQVAVAVATGVKSIAEINGTKFADGGMFSIDGNSHAMGGVPIYAGSKYIGEAQGDEGIGILKRSAFSGFMNFNNSFPADGVSTPTFMQDGGIITQGVAPQELDINQLAQVTISAIAQIPPPIVTVQDINYGVGNVARVQNGADF